MTEKPDLAAPADVAGVIEKLNAYRTDWRDRAASVAVIDETIALLRSQASEITALRGERDTARAESSETIARWCIRMADVRAASGVGVKPMLDELPDAIRARFQALEDKLKTAEGALTVIGNASERSERMFGGSLSDVTLVFENITRVSRQALSSIQKEPGNG